MSGGLRTSVKGHLLAQRLTLASDPLLENETTNNNVTAPLDVPPHAVEEIPMDSTTYGLGICDGNIPCFPMLISAKQGMALYRTRTRADSPPPQGVNMNSDASSVRGPSSPQTNVEILMPSNLRSFHYNELKKATGHFDFRNKLGSSFSLVFKAWIDENSFTATNPDTGMAIAIKTHVQLTTLEQNNEEWLKEINSLGKLSHPNLVKLIGYCIEDDKRFLAYEFIPKGSLERHLFQGDSHVQILSWNLRMKIALGAAKALAYLHSDEAKCIYFGLEISKILLDSNYNVKIYGYSLARKAPKGYRTRLLDNIDELPWYEDKVTHNRGYCGGAYTAPENIFGGEDYLCPRSDVYSFGVVLLEILTGRRAIDRNRRLREHHLVQLAKTKISREREVHGIIDIRMEGHYSKPGAVKAFKLAIQCVSEDPRQRPDMDQVVKILENLQSSGDN